MPLILLLVPGRFVAKLQSLIRGHGMYRWGQRSLDMMLDGGCGTWSQVGSGNGACWQRRQERDLGALFLWGCDEGKGCLDEDTCLCGTEEGHLG